MSYTRSEFPEDVLVGEPPIGSGEGAAGTAVSGAICATAASGASQPSCRYLLATNSLAASP
jgi:hypothetical protein